MLLGAVMALHVFQGGQAPRRERPTIVRDSASTDTVKSRRPAKRLPVTAELLRTAFRDAGARDMLTRARKTRLAEDSSLVSYVAKARQRTTFTLGIGSIGPQRTMYRSEAVSEVSWRAGVGAQVKLTGARVGMPMGNRDDERDDLKENLASSDLTPIPYYPGQEALWIAGGRVRADVNDEDLVNPLANGAEAYYTYASGDSMSWRLPAGQRVRLREIKVRPRKPEWNLVVGSLWFDVESGNLVRAAFRLATPLDLWIPMKEAAKEDSSSSKVGMMIAKAIVSPLQAKLTGVTIEYGLFENKYWLPRVRSFEGTAQIMFVKPAIMLEQSFTYASVNGPVNFTAIAANEPDEFPVRAPDSLSRADARKWRDSVRTALSKRRTAFDDSLKKVSCDSTGYRTLARERRASGQMVAVTYPCDIEKLIASPDFDRPIFDANDDVWGKADRDALLNASLPFGAQALMRFSELPRPDFRYGLSMSRYNRIEGFSTGIGIDQQLGGGYSAGLVGRLGTADREPNIELSLSRTNLVHTATLTGYNRLVSANDWGDPLSFGSSLSAFLFGRDEGFYYRASGAELAWNTDFGPRLDWRLFGEEQRTAEWRNNYSWGTEFIPNIVAARGASAGAAVHWRHDTGVDPRAFRTATDVRLETATGDSTYGRGAIDFTVSRGLTRRTSAAITVGGGSSVGQLTPQRRWFLGGAQTIRGQSPDTTQSGNAFWMSRAELGLDEDLARVALFGDLGWVGDRRAWRDAGRPMSGVGVGYSMMDGLIRFDVARGIYPRTQTRLSAYLNARF